MADDGQVVLRDINWRSTFPFTHIFRTFRVAIHPSKLILGLALLIAIYAGGRVLDAIWPVQSRAVPDEVALYQASSGAYRLPANRERGEPSISQFPFRQQRDDARLHIEHQYADLLLQLGVIKGEGAQAQAQAEEAAYRGDKLGDVENAIITRRDDTIKKENDSYQAELKRIQSENKPEKEKKAETDQATDQHNETLRAAEEQASTDFEMASHIKGDGIFSTFMEYEISQVNGVVATVRSGRLLGFVPAVVPGAGTVAEPSAVGCIYNFLAVGPVWMARAHPLFALVFFVWFLIIWSLFGGAISRIAAVHVARDEKISVRQAMNFAVGKFLSFASAPVIPLLIVLFIGIVVAVVALIGNVPIAGPIIIGAAFILALLAGFIMTLVLLGTIGGFNLMYPTVAVEGSDSFDAISRSFSYVYARPWRMLFYTAVAVIYGAITYLFVHFFIYLMLVLTHDFVSLGFFTQIPGARSLFQTMWPNPADTGRLTYHIDALSLNWAQHAGAVMIALWVYLIIALLGAYAISFYFSANTIIYYLLRQEVDATEMEDVYLEQSDEDFGEGPTGDGGAAVPNEPVPPAAGPVILGGGPPIVTGVSETVVVVTPPENVERPAP